MRSIIKDIKAALRASIKGVGWLGWLIALSKPIAKVMSVVGDIDLLANYLGPVGRFLETGWGTLTSIVLGAVIIGYAILRRAHLEPIGGDQANFRMEIGDRAGSATKEQQTEPSPQEIEKTVAPDAPPYMTAYEALHYMADQSAWGSSVRESASTQNIIGHGDVTMKRIPIYEACFVFSKGARESKIEVLGRLGGNGPHVQIPHTDWLTIGIDNNTLKMRQTSQTTSITPTGTVPLYTDLQIRRGDVYRVWPPNNVLEK